MKWNDIFDMIVSGQLNVNHDVIVYDQETGEEYQSDLIEFEDTGDIAIVINYDEEE